MGLRIYQWQGAVEKERKHFSGDSLSLSNIYVYIICKLPCCVSNHSHFEFHLRLLVDSKAPNYCNLIFNQVSLVLDHIISKTFAMGSAPSFNSVVID